MKSAKSNWEITIQTECSPVMSTENLFFTLYAKHFALKKYYFIIQKQFHNKQDLTTKHNFKRA